MSDHERSISSVLSDIVGDVQQIIRSEVRLAKVEIGEQLGKAKRAVAFMAMAGVLGLLALGLLALTAVYALATVWPPWAAALAVFLATSAIGAALAFSGMRQFKDLHVVPPRTVATLQENIQWAKTPDK